MAHFAQLDENSIVVTVIVVHNNELLNEDGIELEQKGINFCQSLFPNTQWKQTSYNARIRKNYAGIGYIYDKIRDAFIPPQSYLSWTLNEQTCAYEAPIAKPANTTKEYVWNEEALAWIEANNA